MEETATTNRIGVSAIKALRVLLGDDDVGIQQLLVEVLQEAGFEVITAGNRREAVEIFERQEGHIDAVLLDMSKARPSAVDALARLRATDAGAKVVLLTGNSKLDTVEETMGKGFNAFVPKPFTVSELIDPLRRLVGVNGCATLAI